LNKRIKSSISVGAQDVFYEEQGAYTGQISPIMLRDMGIKYIIIGHSERRMRGETDEDIAKKVQVSLENDIYAILCVYLQIYMSTSTYMHIFWPSPLYGVHISS
jgi:triosephosphate isomerase